MSLEHLDILENKIKGVVALLVDMRNKTAELEKANKDLQQKLVQKDQELQQLNTNIDTIKKKAAESEDYEKEREMIRVKVENMLKHLKKLEGNM